MLKSGAAAALGLSGLARAQTRPAPLVVWFTVEGAKAFRRIGERFTAETGVELIVETPDPIEGPSKFQQAAESDLVIRGGMRGAPMLSPVPGFNGH